MQVVGVPGERYGEEALACVVEFYPLVVGGKVRKAEPRERYGSRRAFHR